MSERETTHRVMFEGGPFHGRIATFKAPPPNHAKINRGEYEMVGRTEAGLFLLRWKGPQMAVDAATGEVFEA